MLLVVSISPRKVETPVTLRSSSSVCPSTSIDALISTLDVKVDTPVTSKFPPTIKSS